MDRILKFRIWDIKNKNFVNPKDYNLSGIRHFGDVGELLLDFNGKLRFAMFPVGNGDNSADSVFNELHNQENYITQQFTGLLDKNGKEIYDGDILQFKPIRIVNFSSFIGQVYYDEEEACYYHTFLEGRPPKRMWGRFSEYSYEIIGNIFENSNLLK